MANYVAGDSHGECERVQQADSVTYNYYHRMGDTMPTGSLILSAICLFTLVICNYFFTSYMSCCIDLLLLIHQSKQNYPDQTVPEQLSVQKGVAVQTHEQRLDCSFNRMW